MELLTLSPLKKTASGWVNLLIQAFTLQRVPLTSFYNATLGASLARIERETIGTEDFFWLRQPIFDGNIQLRVIGGQNLFEYYLSALTPDQINADAIRQRSGIIVPGYFRPTTYTTISVKQSEASSISPRLERNSLTQICYETLMQ